MAIDSITNVDASYTFQQWWTTTNEIINKLNNVVTMEPSDAPNADDVILAGSLKTTDAVDGVMTNVLSAASGNELNVDHTIVKFAQQQIIYVPTSGKSDTIQFTKAGTPAGDFTDNTWSLGPVDASGSGISQHADFQITGINGSGNVLDNDALFTFRRSNGNTKGKITGTFIEIDNAILPAQINKNCATATKFSDDTVINFGGASGAVAQGDGHVSGQITFHGGEGSAIDAELAVDFSSIRGVQDLQAGSGLTIVSQHIDGVSNDGNTLGGNYPTGTMSHANTSDVADSENTGNNVIQDLTFDEFGHVASVGIVDLANTLVKVNPSTNASRSKVSNKGILFDSGTYLSFKKQSSATTADEVKLYTSSNTFNIDSGGHTEIKLVADEQVIIASDTGNQFKFDTEFGALTCEGDITAFGNASDRSLKENIEPITDALDKVNSINGYTFNYIDAPEKGRVPGVIAQELEIVLPEAVYEIDDGKKAVRYDNTIALLVEAIKELKQQVDELKGK